jgi:hypothetical protein
MNGNMDQFVCVRARVWKATITNLLYYEGKRLFYVLGHSLEFMIPS